MTSFHEDYPLASNRTALAPPFSARVEDVVLAADTIERIAIPTGQRFAIFSFDGAVRALLGTASTSFTLPSVSTSDGSGSILNPGARRFPNKLADGVTTPTHVILRAPAACTGSIEFYE